MISAQTVRASRPSRTIPDRDDYDVIVIGSGIGGLGAASMLAQLKGKRVLVLEQHFKLGGYTHSFRRKGFTFDPGVHYVSGMAPDDRARKLMDLATDAKVEWHKLPDRFEHFSYPEFSFDVPSDPERYRNDLITRFPAEEKAIRRYFKDLTKAAKWLEWQVVAGSSPPWQARLIRPMAALTNRVGMLTTGEYLQRNFTDPKLRALLSSQWMDYGLPPQTSSFAIHSLVTGAYLTGAYYPVGGAEVLADAMAAVVTAAGGICAVNHEVTALELDASGRACGVTVRAGGEKHAVTRTFRAPCVISDIGWRATMNLVPQGAGGPVRKALSAIPPGYSMLTVYLGLNADPTTIGLQPGNHWLFDGPAHRVASVEELLDGQARNAFLVTASARHITATKPTAQVLCAVDMEPFKPWQDLPWRRRGADYDAMKEQMADALIALVDRYHPGFADLVEFREVATPLSVASFTGYRDGATFGLPASPQRFEAGLVGTRTSVPGLVLTGSDACCLGVEGALTGAAFAAGAAIGPMGLGAVMKSAYERAAQRAEAAEREAAVVS